MSEQDNFQKFYDYLLGLFDNYSKLADTLREKIAAIDSGDTERLAEIMKEEQAHVLISRGFDESLKTHRKLLGLSGDTLSDAIQQLPDEHREDFHLLHLKLRSKLDEVRGLIDTCRQNTETRLEIIERKLRELDPASAPSYSEDKKTKGGSKKGLFDKSI